MSILVDNSMLADDDEELRARARVPYLSPINVRDVERLAKAGVKIDYLDVKDQLLPDVERDDKFQMRCFPMVDAFWERWRRANDNNARNAIGEMEMFHIYAFEEGDKVIVIASTGKEHVEIVDEKPLYPSDALMAALHLWKQTK